MAKSFLNALLDAAPRPSHAESLYGRPDPRDLVPRDHEISRVVPRGGAMCANCHFLSSPNSCSNELYQRWAGSETLGAPADEWLCDFGLMVAMGHEAPETSSRRRPHRSRPKSLRRRLSANGGAADLDDDN